jgi:hypothetical protein
MNARRRAIQPQKTGSQTAGSVLAEGKSIVTRAHVPEGAFARSAPGHHAATPRAKASGSSSPSADWRSTSRSSSSSSARAKKTRKGSSLESGRSLRAVAPPRRPASRAVPPLRRRDARASSAKDKSAETSGFVRNRLEARATWPPSRPRAPSSASSAANFSGARRAWTCGGAEAAAPAAGPSLSAGSDGRLGRSRASRSAACRANLSAKEAMTIGRGGRKRRQRGRSECDLGATPRGKRVERRRAREVPHGARRAKERTRGKPGRQGQELQPCAPAEGRARSGPLR